LKQDTSSAPVDPKAKKDAKKEVKKDDKKGGKGPAVVSTEDLEIGVWKVSPSVGSVPPESSVVIQLTFSGDKL